MAAHLGWDEHRKRREIDSLAPLYQTREAHDRFCRRQSQIRQRPHRARLAQDQGRRWKTSFP